MAMRGAKQVAALPDAPDLDAPGPDAPGLGALARIGKGGACPGAGLQDGAALGGRTGDVSGTMREEKIPGQKQRRLLLNLLRRQRHLPEKVAARKVLKLLNSGVGNLQQSPKVASRNLPL